MKTALFIARRLAAQVGRSFSGLIMRIAVLAIALSMSVMIIASATVAGFQSQISEKIFGFWGHIHITGSLGVSSYNFEPQPINRHQPYYPHADTIGRLYNEDGSPRTKGGVRHIQAYAHKGGIIKTKDQIEGIVLRGVGADYDWAFLRRYLIAGDTLACSAPLVDEDKADILISETTAKRLKLGLGDAFPIYFAQGEQSQAKQFIVRGIFKTGLEEYDRRFALADLRVIQSLNNWRPYKTYGPELWLAAEELRLVGLNLGTLDEHLQTLQSRLQQGKLPDWNDTASRDVLVPDFLAERRGWKLGDSIGLQYTDDSQENHQYRLKVCGIFAAPDEAAWRRSLWLPWSALQSPNQSLDEQVSGFEVFLDNLDDLDDFGIHFNYEVLRGRQHYASTLREAEPNIFDWLNLTDMNERIISLLMILVAIINMTTALLILILERTNMIGILKALGATNWGIRQIFLLQAAYIIGWGLFWGNLLGLGFCILQDQFHLIRLPEEMYYVAYAPVSLDFWRILGLNLGTLAITLGVLILPSWLVSNIEPVKAIRFK